MVFDALKEALLELIAPTRCAGCERPGSVLCASCVAWIVRYRDTHPCPRCGAPYGELVCTECQGVDFAFDRVWCLGELDGPLARAVVIYKDAFEIRLGAELGDMLAQRCLGQMASEGVTFDLVTWIPPTKHALRRRGYDHAGILAQRVNRCLGVDGVQMLARRPMRDLRHLSREQRSREVKDTYRWIEETVSVCGLSVLVIDDVMTTGSTLDGAARHLLAHGARTVTGAVLARAW